MGTPPPLLDASDLLILAALAAGGIYWLVRSNKASKLLKPGGANGLLRPLSPGSGASSRSNSPLTNDRSLANRFTRDAKDIVILFGSQTGTAEDYSARLSKDATRYGLQSLVADPDDLDIEELTQVPQAKLIVFVVATYGEGEPTDNAVGLIEWIRQQYEEHGTSDDGEKPLANLHYAVFGLGNKTYEQFNAAARNIDKWCSALGGTRVGPRGEGDDDGSLEDDFQAWRDAVWPEIATHFHVDLERAAMENAANSVRSFALERDQAKLRAHKHQYRGELGDPRATAYDAKNPFYARIVRTRELFSGKEQHRNCVHVEFDLTGSKLTYTPGDHLAMWPETSEREVLNLARALGLQEQLDDLFSLDAIDPAARKRHPFPCPTTWRAAFTHYLDISLPPKPHVLQSWVPHLPEGSASRGFYAKLASDKDAYTEEVANHHKTVGDLLSEHPAPEIPLDVILEGFTRIQPRYYSISSSPRYLQQQGGADGGNGTTGAHVHITATVLRYDSVSRTKLVEGLATRYLFELHERLMANPGAEIKVPVAIRHSAFKLPRQNATPVIMIGPGTGVAPFRGFVQERCAAVARAASAAAAAGGAAAPASAQGDVVLFYGCRYRAHDYLYEEEWVKYQTGGGIHALHVAFSRDGPQKVYVQHKLAEQRDAIWALLKRGAHVYVCGDAKHMAHDVNQWFIDTARELDGLSEEKAARFVKDLKNRGRYLEDVWS